MDKFEGAWKHGNREIVFLKQGFLYESSFVRFVKIMSIQMKYGDRVLLTFSQNDFFYIFAEGEDLLKIYHVLFEKWMEFVRDEHLKLSVSLDERLKKRFDDFRQEITLMPMEIDRVTESFYKGAASMVSEESLQK